MSKRKRVSEGGILPKDKRILKAMEDLRHDVENSNQFSAISLGHGDIYREKDVSEFKWKKIDGVLLGYKLEEAIDGVFTRYIWFVTPGYRINEIPEDERTPITAAIFSAGLDQGAGDVDMFMPTDDSILISQQFTPVYLFERQPNLVTLAGVH